MLDIESDFQRKLAEIDAVSMGLTPWDPGMYLPVSDAKVVGLVHADMQTANLLWVY